MAANDTASKTTKRKSRRSKQVVAAGDLPSVETLEKSQNRVINEHGQAENTQKAYAAYVSNGKKFLAAIVEAGKSTSDSQGATHRDDEPTTIGTLLHDPKFAVALDGIPNEHTPEALVLFITQKCVMEENGISTAQGIRAAFKKHWERLAGDTYRDKWHQDPVTKLWLGNPSEAAVVQDLMSALKHKQGADGCMRQHSRAMRYEYMVAICKWSESICPAEVPPKNAVEAKLYLKHLQLRAFVTTAFVIWTRNDELIRLKRGDIEFGCKGPSPYFELHFQIFLSNRKGWQRKLDHNERDYNRNVFGIYDQPDKHAINCFFHLQKYMNYLEAYHYTLVSDDFIFPATSCNGIVQRGDHISTATVQSLIDEAADMSGIQQSKTVHFSTHCFRRGGAQYRFMLAPFGERWPMEWIRWWGGWAENESADTLMKYLLDDLQSYERSHTHALNKTAPDPTKSFMSEHSLLQTASVAEVRSAHSSLQEQITNLREEMWNGFNTILTRLDERDSSHSTNREPLTELQVSQNQLRTLTSQLPQAQVRTTLLQPSVVPRIDHIPAPSAPSATEIPLGLCIPDLPLKGRKKEDSLEDILLHWEKPAPNLCLFVALKDWPKEWYTGVNRKKFASKRDQRKQVALEYIEEYKRDDDAFKRAYPGWRDGHTALYKAVIVARKKAANVASADRMDIDENTN